MAGWDIFESQDSLAGSMRTPATIRASDLVTDDILDEVLPLALQETECMARFSRRLVLAMEVGNRCRCGRRKSRW